MLNTKEEMDFKDYYLREFIFFDGECDITFNIIGINYNNKTIQVAITNRGKISVIEYDLYQDQNNDLYFNYGVDRNKIEINEFEQIKD